MKTKFTCIIVFFFILSGLSIKILAQHKYNVLFIAADDMNDRCSLFGNNEPASPNLKRLASHGMVFTHAYAQFPICNPSRTSLLTGWRPDKTGIKENNVRPRSIIGPDVLFLPEYFRKYNYHTERYGKIMHGTFENDITWDYAEPPEKADGDDTTGIPANVSWWVRNIDDSLLEDARYTKDLITRMQQPHSQPFFYGLGFNSTHLPFDLTLKYWNMNGDSTIQQPLKTDKFGNYNGLKGNSSANIQLPNTPPGDRNDVPPIAFLSQIIFADTAWKNMVHAYDGELSMMDAQLGLVLDEMDRQQLWRNTIVVLWSDHGQHLGEHEGEWRKNTLFEESLHVPLIVCVPGKAAGTCSQLVELVDLYPTLTELCGLPPPPDMEGTSFAPLLDNAAFSWKPAVFSQVSRVPGDLGRSITTVNARYNNWGAFGEELYNREVDPKEYNNLISYPDDSALVNKMHSMLSDGWTKALPPVYTKSVWYRDADNDGYGSYTNSIQSYWTVGGYVINNFDCNDSDASVNPMAEDICDGKDNNCNGLVDEPCISKLSISDKSIVEGNNGIKTLRFTVSLSQPATNTISFNFLTSDSTALPGSDYISVSKIIKILPGQTSKKIAVSIIGDIVPEKNEYFKATLSGAKNALIQVGSAYGMIRNDDGSVAIKTATDESSLEKDNIPADKRFAKIWPNPAASTLSVEFNGSVSGTAKIQIINLTGIKVSEWIVNSYERKTVQLNVAKINNGEYFLLISDAKGNQQTEKILIQH